MIESGLFVVILLAALALFVLARTAIVVPQQSAYVVERLGRYSGTLDAGFHILVPFMDVIRYRHSLKETAVDIPAQVCITRDNVQVGVDGVLYLKVLNPERASYGISDHLFAISQLAQTTLRSEVGKIDLDRSFEERTNINTAVVAELDKATEPWGVKVLRYEIKNITPPADVLAAMEKQMRAEREKRAVILTSEGQRDAAINNAEGEKQQVIKVGSPQAAADQRSRGIFGHPPSPRPPPKASAGGGSLASSPAAPRPFSCGWPNSISEFGKVINNADTVILPSNLADVAGVITTAMNVVAQSKR
ncbi:MAG: SPFH domain-containing protein [Vicinamibacterales bacterium]